MKGDRRVIKFLVFLSCFLKLAMMRRVQSAAHLKSPTALLIGLEV